MLAVSSTVISSIRPATSLILSVIRYRSIAKMTESADHPLSGLWQPNRLERMYYGPSTVEKHLVSCLPSPKSKAFIITGSSLATKTPLVSQVEKILGSQHHAGTFSNITQHAPVAQLDEATDAVAKDSAVDTLISIGGGSPIDSAKAISYRAHEKGGEFLHHITIPTTLSAAECTFIAGYTDKQGLKIAVGEPQLAPHVIIYDAKFAVDTPQRLLLSTAIRSLDHAVELMYHPTSTEMPAKAMALSAIEALFTYLPKAKNDPKNEEYITRLQLAAFNSLFSVGTGIAKGMGLSHSLGYALGSPYGIPHGITSCLTLAGVVRLKAEKADNAAQLARILPFIGQTKSGDNKADAIKVGDAIDELINGLGLGSTLKQYGVGEDQIPKVAKLATKSEEGELYEKVSSLVRSKL